MVFMSGVKPPKILFDVLDLNVGCVYHFMLNQSLMRSILVLS